MTDYYALAYIMKTPDASTPPNKNLLGPQGSVSVADNNGGLTSFPTFMFDGLSSPNVLGVTGTIKTSQLFFDASNVRIGPFSGQTGQASSAIAMGFGAGQFNQQANTIAIGQAAGQTGQGSGAIAIGFGAGQTGQGANAIAIGQNAGQTGQGASAIAIGFGSGQTGQGASAIAIGQNAGQNNRGQTGGIAIGANAGQFNQGTNSIAVGSMAGQTGQGASANAMGFGAGQFNQQANAIAIGQNAGQTGQGLNAIAIGTGAGQTGQGLNSIAIGALAGQPGQAANSIVLNASGSVLNAPTASALYVKPVRAETTNFSNYNQLSYNATTSEVVSFPVASVPSIVTLQGQVDGLLATVASQAASIATLQSTQFGIGQTWQNMASVRGPGSTYTNSTNKSIVVYINMFNSSGAFGGFNVIVGGVDFGIVYAAPATYMPFTIIVPPQVTYGITNNNSYTLHKWFELR